MHRRALWCALGGLALCASVLAQDEPTARERIVEQAENAGPLVESELATTFLATAADLAPVEDRTIMFRREDRSGLTMAQAEGMSEEELEGYSETTLTEFHYYNLYSTPIAWARPLDVLAGAGMTSVDGKRVLDFGFGNVGQLRMLASMGADVVGVEIEGIQSAMYSLDEDQGSVARSDAAGEGADGSLTLAFGQWPAEAGMVDAVGGGFDLIMTKNVLKYGYIHPEREANPAALVHLGVDDETFLRAAHDAMSEGGWFLIYNLYPPQAAEDEPYIPWAYGENPFARDLVEAVGFEVVAWNVPDSPAIHALGRALGWDAQDPESFERDFNAMYTILRKSPNGTE
jgi:hypothetical protein